jgi:nitroreductase
VSSDMPFTEVIRRQRMIRAPYADTPVPRELVEEVLLDARKAPSAGFAQGARFLVLEADQTERFYELAMPPGTDVSVLQPTPVIVLPLEDRQAYLDRYSEPDKIEAGLTDAASWPVPYWTVDTAFASMVVLLGATARGLGAWFFGIFNNERTLLDELGVPAGVRAIGAIALGYPREDSAANRGSAATRPRRPASDVVRFRRWDGPISSV